MKRAEIVIKGFVQGVFYRASTKEKAQEIGVTGYVENKPDGTVYIEVEGNEQQIHDLIQWCKEGPPAAEVEEVVSEVINVNETLYTTFEVTY